MFYAGTLTSFRWFLRWFELHISFRVFKHKTCFVDVSKSFRYWKTHKILILAIDSAHLVPFNTLLNHTLLIILYLFIDCVKLYQIVKFKSMQWLLSGCISSFKRREFRIRPFTFRTLCFAGLPPWLIFFLVCEVVLMFGRTLLSSGKLGLSKYRSTYFDWGENNTMTLDTCFVQRY